MAVGKAEACQKKEIVKILSTQLNHTYTLQEKY